VEQLSKELYCSAASVYRKIRALTGQTPNQYLRAFRLAKAKRLLAHSDLPITAVAIETGFHEPGVLLPRFPEGGGDDADGVPEEEGEYLACVRCAWLQGISQFFKRDDQLLAPVA